MIAREQALFNVGYVLTEPMFQQAGFRKLRNPAIKV